MARHEGVTTMPTISKHTLYNFDELSDRAKEKAREWYREGALDFDWYDSVYDDASHIGDILGININKRAVKLMNGSTRYDPSICFGLWVQGSGAYFDATYEYAKSAAKKIREYAPQDSELHRIADALQQLQRKAFYRLTANIKTSGNYSHSRAMTIDISDAPNETTEEELSELIRDFADWIYKQLDSEATYCLSDECVDENIEANEYTFDEQGNRDD
jgi:hypothetical protein